MATNTPKDPEPTTTTTAPTFTKEQLMQSKRFARRADILAVLLEDDRQYTISEAQTLVNNIMKGVV